MCKSTHLLPGHSTTLLTAGISHARTPGIRLGLAIFSVPQLPRHTHTQVHAYNPSEQKILLLPDNPSLMTLIKKAKYPVQWVQGGISTAWVIWRWNEVLKWKVTLETSWEVLKFSSLWCEMFCWGTKWNDNRTMKLKSFFHTQIGFHVVHSKPIHTSSR